MKLSPRIRMQSGNGRRTAIIFFSLITSMVVIFTFTPVSELFVNTPSWRNVSFYQILKMHLSARPTHMSQLYRCPRFSSPGVRKSDLNLNNIQFYEKERHSFRNLSPEHQWRFAFMPAMQREDKISLMLLYAVFKFAMDSAGLEHIVIHGSAMGAWRHHGLTPWDDDIDIAIPVKDWLKIKQVLSCIEGYTLDYSSNSKWAFYLDASPKIQGTEKRWPFLDLFLYTQDDTYVWGLNYVHMRRFVFLKEDVFPTQTVPFECFMVPVPRHLRRVLEHEYVDPEKCVSHHTNHKTGADKLVITVPCAQVASIYTMYFTHN